jgi:ParB family chromosome partitioning protein
MCQKIQTESWSVRKTEEAVRAVQQPTDTIPFPGPEAAAEKKSKSHPMTNHVASLQDQLREWLGTKVEIKLKGKAAGKIIIDFASNDDFERLLGVLRRAA